LRASRDAATVPRLARILIIEDDRAIRDLFRGVLGDEGYELVFVDGLEQMRETAPDLVITDLVDVHPYRAGSARAWVARVKGHYPATPVIVCTASEQATEELDRLGAEAVLPKPFNIEKLVETVVRLAGH
jgi:CheY-like chemotaxis protein